LLIVITALTKNTMPNGNAIELSLLGGQHRRLHKVTIKS